ncbi:DNA-binding response regulator, NarL/FixJ family, contains REC and HTH domains [Streptomyces sp. 3213]|uniref:response regulator transcription factor n=1 Tax=Streptomyces sp. 3213.3 TaxID=1855348 RepID=UPI0008948195|nr:response regulator transcription factor [Streptomyces sp. 3213.3]SEE98593.1 DNA-binding response regulator, NarL/FixJ family, contains REC and HTH domains [Streptomyces sp. 3213] [Streptomyces sp. 3213.3]
MRNSGRTPEWTPREEGPAAVRRTDPLRIVLADDERLFRSALAALLESRGHRITAQVGDADALRAAVARTDPDLAVIDIRMPPTKRLEGLRAAVDIRQSHPGVGILLLSQSIQVTHLTELTGSGVRGVGYLLKERVADEHFLDTVRRIAEGECEFDQEVLRLLFNGPDQQGRLARLSAREREVLKLMAQGLTNPAIASHLVVTVKTVETHVGSVFKRLGLPDESEGEYHRRVLAVLTYLQSDRTV